MNDVKKTQNWHNIIGASLSKPSTSLSAVYVCLFEPTTYRKFQMSALKYFTKIEGL